MSGKRQRMKKIRIKPDREISRLCAFEINNLDRLHDFLYSPSMDKLMVAITSTGNMGLIWIVCALVMMLVEPSFAQGYAILIAILLSVMLGNLLLKNTIRRTRPFSHKKYKLLIKQPWDFSFPSGHTMSSFAAATVLSSFNLYLGIGCFIYAILIALSRLYLRVHFFTDVIFSSIIGTALGILAVYAIDNGYFDFLPLITPPII